MWGDRLTAQATNQRTQISRVGKAISAILILTALSVASVDAAPLASYQLSAGSATFGLVLPRGAATDGVQIGSLATQTDVKNRWPDGSIKFAVVSAQIPATGTYALNASSGAAGSFTPTWPSIVLSLVINGTTWTATPGGFSAANGWLNGPVARETRVTAKPTNGTTQHPQLDVVFDIRSYANGAHRIDATVQNVRDAVSMDKVGATSASLMVNGATIWAHGAVTTYSMTRWRHVEWIGGTEAAITPDFEPTYLAGALPRVISSVVNTSYDLPGPNYGLMGGRPKAGNPAITYGEMNPDMAAGGGRQEIAPLNWWEAVYLAHKTQNQRLAVLRNGDLTGAWSNHLAKPDGSIIKLGDPGYDPAGWWWDPRATSGNRPLAAAVAETNWRGAREGTSADTDTGSVGVSSRYNEEHVPAPMYVPYLLTGDRYYVDQAKFWATRAILTAKPFWELTDPVNFPGWKRGRNGATGNERILDFTGMTREFGWPLRLVGITAWIIPDADSDRSYFLTTVQNNLNHVGEYLDVWVRLGYGGALGSIGGAESTSGWSLTRNGQETGRYTSNWRLAYTAYAVDWCTRQDIWTIRPSVEAFVNRVVNLAIAMNVQNPEFLAGKSGLSHPYYAVFNTMSGGVFTRWFNTFSELKTYNETYLYQDSPAVGNAVGWNPNEAETGYYNTEHHFVLEIGVRRGLPDAQRAQDRLKQVTGHLPDLKTRAGYAITFSSSGSWGGGSTTNAPVPPANVQIIR
jgi:hypothetical protein